MRSGHRPAALVQEQTAHQHVAAARACSKHRIACAVWSMEAGAGTDLQHVAAARACRIAATECTGWSMEGCTRLPTKQCTASQLAAQHDRVAATHRCTASVRSPARQQQLLRRCSQRQCENPGRTPGGWRRCRCPAAGNTETGWTGQPAGRRCKGAVRGRKVGSGQQYTQT